MRIISGKYMDWRVKYKKRTPIDIILNCKKGIINDTIINAGGRLIGTK